MSLKAGGALTFTLESLSGVLENLIDTLLSRYMRRVLPRYGRDVMQEGAKQFARLKVANWPYAQNTFVTDTCSWFNNPRWFCWGNCQQQEDRFSTHCSPFYSFILPLFVAFVPSNVFYILLNALYYYTTTFGENVVQIIWMPELQFFKHPCLQ